MVGRPGMVARVDGWTVLPDGYLVVLQEEAGLLTELVASDTPVDSWLCRLLGEPAAVNGRPRRVLYVPDQHLTAVGAMNADQVQELKRQQAEADADALVADLGRMLQGNDVEIDDDQLARAGEQALIEHSLEHVATATALREAGFRAANPGGSMLHRDLSWGAVQLRLEASPTPFGTWLVASAGAAHGVIDCDEATLPGEWPRGRILAEVLRMWKNACPQAPMPVGLSPGEVFRRHEAAVRAAARAPSIDADPEVFRSIRLWLRKRHAGRPQSPLASLRHEDGLLRIEVDGEPFGCPASGLWPEPCTIALADLLTLDVRVFRRRRLTLTLTPQALDINGSVIRRH